MKIVGKNTRPLRYDLNQIPYDYTVEVTNRFKGLDLIGGSDGKASVYNAGDLGSIPGLGRSPGEERETHSSILAWKIPWMEEPGRLQSTGSKRVRHD